MSERDIHICTSFDAGMATPAAVLAQSIKQNTNENRTIHMHFLHSPDLDDLDLRKFFPENDDSFRSNFYRVDEFRLENIPLARFPKAAFYRLLIEDYVNATRVLFLDADTLALNDVGILYDIDLQGHAIAAMQDYVITDLYPRGEADFGGRKIHYRQYVEQDIGLSDANNYINSGVMLVEISEWRRLDIRDRSLDYCRSMPSLVFADQDAINWCLNGDVFKIDPRWNALVNFSGRMRNPATPIQKICDTWYRQPWIAHYAGYSKPWKPSMRLTPHDRLYRSIAARSACAARFRSAYQRSVDELSWRQRWHVEMQSFLYWFRHLRSSVASSFHDLKEAVAKEPQRRSDGEG